MQKSLHDNIAEIITYLVETHIPDDQTLRLCFTSYDIPANRVLASFGKDDDSPSNFDSHPRRKRETAPGLGLAINKSLSAGTRRVSEKVDFTLQRIRVLFDKLPCSHTRKRYCNKLCQNRTWFANGKSQTRISVSRKIYLFFPKYDRCNAVLNIKCSAHAKCTV